MNSHTVRRLAAVLVAIMGGVDIVSAVLPEIPHRVELLRDLLPFDIIHGSSTATVLAGFCLILVANGLRMRRSRALHLTVGLLLLSVVLHLTKGLDVEEAALALVLAGWLFTVRGVFDIPSRVLTPRRLLGHLGEAFILYWSYVLIGFVVLRRGVRPTPDLENVVLEPFRLLVGTPHFLYVTHHAGWFEDSLTVVACIFAIYAVALSLVPLISLARPTETEIARATALVRTHGSDTLSYFALQDGRSYYFLPDGSAFLSYRLWGNVALVGGDPVGPPHRIVDCIRSFQEVAKASGMQPCFLGIAAETVHLYREAGLRTLKIGEEALVDLRTFEAPSLKRKVRRAARHIEEIGVSMTTYRSHEIPADVEAAARAIDREWVEIKGGAERGFSMTLGRFPRPDDEGCEVTVAACDGKVIGFVSVVPVYGTRSWSLDAMRRSPNSPNGLMEAMIIHLCERYRDAGYRTLSLNFASLANSVDDMTSRVLDETRRFIFDNLSGVYQLKTLAQFNSKFNPTWRSRYLAYGDILTFPKYVLAVVQAEDPIRLPRLVADRH
jgi:phosphatidylglycerol lysyltransferase